MSKRPELDPKAFAKTRRKPVSRSESGRCNAADNEAPSQTCGQEPEQGTYAV